MVRSRSAAVTIAGTGPLPPVGQRDNGDGTFTLKSRSAQVSLRVRAGDGEMIGTGYAAVSFTMSRLAGQSWMVTVDGAVLLPRMDQPDRERTEAVP